jgi:hypothetical protein
VQPIELARKLVKEMDDHRNVSVSKVYVPNEFTVYLSSDDRKQFDGYEEALVGELQEYLAEHARRERYALLDAPRVLVTTDDDLAVGEFGIATRVAQPEEGVPSLPVPAAPARSVSIPAAPVAPPAVAPPPPPAPALESAPSTTMIYPARAWPDASVEASPAPEPPREVVAITLAGHAHPITSRSFVIGRSRECDLRVTDGNASRRHAEIVQEGSVYVLVDLGSTNGTELNGRRVTRHELADGDRITIGATDLVFSRSSS